MLGGLGTLLAMNRTVHRDVVTRFAPSPTGHLHVGGARTALFNWAFARQAGGSFVLRVEDTDVARSSVESTLGILEDLRWLGIDWDEGPSLPENGNSSDDLFDPATQAGEFGPYFQSERGHLYREFLQKLLDSRRAYKCFKSPEELDAMRQAARAAGRPYQYDPTDALAMSDQEIAARESAGEPFVIRFHMPDHDVTVDDLILGPVTIARQELEDFVIIKSSRAGGGPTFHFANVVDDATMGITHVLRAQEHLMNTPKHVAMFEALGLTPPAYGHMPLIFNSDGSKMSKRDKAKAARAAARTAGLTGLPGVEAAAWEAFIGKKSDDLAVAGAIAEHLGLSLPEIDVFDFRRSGYLPATLLNYLSLLGWSPGNDIERFDLSFLVEHFDLKRVGKANARFDRAKLLAFNTDAIAALQPDHFRSLLAEHLRSFHPEYDRLREDASRFALFAESYRPRSRTLEEPAINGRFFVADDAALTWDAKAVRKVLLKNDGRGLTLLSGLLQVLRLHDDWEAASLEAVIAGYASDQGANLGDVAQPLRVAVSGGTVSPPINDTLVILGKASTLARIERTLQEIPAMGEENES